MLAAVVATLGYVVWCKSFKVNRFVYTSIFQKTLPTRMTNKWNVDVFYCQFDIVYWILPLTHS